MFRIGVIELALTCGLVLLIIVVPVIVARYHARMDERLKQIEKRLNPKDR